MEVMDMPITKVANNVTVIPRKIKKEQFTLDNIEKKKRVCGYARVSTDMEEQASSYAAQVDYYTNLIKGNPSWEYVDLYSDEGISATSTKKREGFNRMINDAMDGKIDLIITKSISRFARNTVDALTNIRKLKDKGIEVYFEKENIHTLDSSGELMLSILSALSQEESRSISGNTTWGKRKAFADGKVTVGYSRFLGYDKGADGKLVINKEQAETVKLIFRLFLKGLSIYQIKKELERLKVKTVTGNRTWHVSTIRSELRNEKYKGDALLQKEYTVDFLTKKKKKNKGEIQQYYVTDDHEPIIDKQTFDFVQIELDKRLNINTKNHGNKYTCRYSGISIFSGKIICGDCGSYFGKKVWHSNDKYKKIVYRCNNKYRDKICETMSITEDEIKELFICEYNKLNKKATIEDAKLIRDELCDTGKLENEKIKLIKEKERIEDANNKLILENSEKAIDQKVYNEKRKELSIEYNKLEVKINNIESELLEKHNKCIVLDDFIKNLKNSIKINDFDEDLFCALVENVIVYKDRAEIKWRGAV